MGNKTASKPDAVLEATKPIIEGYLWKRSHSKGNWRRRYFILFHDRIDYYGKKHEKQVRGKLWLNKNFFVSDNILKKVKHARNHGFMMSDFSVTYYLAAETEDMKKSWTHTLASTVKLLRDHDSITDTPVLLGKPLRTKSMDNKALKARMENYQKLQELEKTTGEQLQKPSDDVNPKEKKLDPTPVKSKQEKPRDVRVRTLAVQAAGAHTSARESAQVNLGLQVMSFEEREDLVEVIKDAEAEKFLADVENEAATHMAEQTFKEAKSIRKDLKKAQAEGDGEAVEKLEAAFQQSKEKVTIFEEAALRSAKERAKAGELLVSSQSKVAEGIVANEIVLELAKDTTFSDPNVDLNSAAVRVKTLETAEKVRNSVLEESSKIARIQSESQQDLQKAVSDQDRKLSLESVALSEASTGRADTNKVKRATLDRLNADRKVLKAETKVVEIANERLDAVAKAAAVERALNKVNNNGSNEYDVEAYGFAALRREREDRARKQAKKSKRISIPAIKKHLSNSKKTATKAMQKARSSIARSKKQSVQRPVPKNKPIKRRESPPDYDPAVEAMDSFRSFFNSFTQVAIDTVEVVTGLAFDDGEYSDEYYSSDDLYDESETEYDEEYDSDEYYMSESEDEFEDQMRNVGDKERIAAASAWIAREIDRLVDIIEEMGRKDSKGRKYVTFIELLGEYENISDTLVGILLRAKNTGRVQYAGEMLFEEEDARVKITVLR